MDLTESKVVVTTQKEIANQTYEGDWFWLSDYGDIVEFYNACHSYFENEKEPVFRYEAWEHIPDILINKKWFCPNFFEIRDALERLDEEENDYFLSWCGIHGYNIAVDDPYMLVGRYQENHTFYPEYDNESLSVSDDNLYQSITCNYPYMDRYALEVFDDNYD